MSAIYQESASTPIIKEVKDLLIPLLEKHFTLFFGYTTIIKMAIIKKNKVLSKKKKKNKVKYHFREEKKIIGGDAAPFQIYRI